MPIFDPSTAIALDAVGPIPKEQLYEKVSAAIIEQIRARTLRAGQRLPAERELARAFGVSRPSLREALAALQVLGVIETRHGFGSCVAENALELLADQPDGLPDLGVSAVALLEARAIVEPAIAACAAERFVPDPEIDRLLEMMREASDWENPAHRVTWSDADRLYHQRLAVHSRNPVFANAADFIASVQAQLLWRRMRDETLAVPDRIASAVQEHERIYDAIRNGRPREAEAAARDHVQGVLDSMGLESPPW
jgi:DNA-binding FadR family transcriptional regulator